MGCEQLGWHELVRWRLERADLVGRLLVWLELERAYLVGSHLERVGLVGQDMERADLVRPHVERVRVVRWLMGHRRRALVPVLGRLDEHLVGRLGAAARFCPSPFALNSRMGAHDVAVRRDDPDVVRSARRAAAAV